MKTLQSHDFSLLGDYEGRTLENVKGKWLGNRRDAKESPTIYTYGKLRGMGERLPRIGWYQEFTRVHIWKVYVVFTVISTIKKHSHWRNLCDWGS